MSDIKMVLCGCDCHSLPTIRVDGQDVPRPMDNPCGKCRIAHGAERHKVVVSTDQGYTYRKTYTVQVTPDDDGQGQLHVVMTPEGLVVDLFFHGEQIDTWALTAQEFTDDYFSVCPTCAEAFSDPDEGCDTCADDPRKAG